MLCWKIDRTQFLESRCQKRPQGRSNKRNHLYLFLQQVERRLRFSWDVYKLVCIGKKIAFTIEKAILLFVLLEYERNIKDCLVLVLALALIAVEVTNTWVVFVEEIII